MNNHQITIQVFECKDDPGYIVKLTVLEGDREQISRFPCPDLEEAEALAASIKTYAELGCDLSALLPDGDSQ